VTTLTAVGTAIDRWFGYISKGCMLLCACALVFLLVIFGWLVFGRYVLNVTPTWVEQMALVLVCYITFLGAAIGVYEDNHLGVTFFRNALSSRWSTLLHAVSDFALAAFGLVMMSSGWELVQFGWSTKLAMLNVPEGVRTLPVAILGGLMFLFAGARGIAKIRSLAVDSGSANSGATQ